MKDNKNPLLLNVITPQKHLEKDLLVEEIVAPAYKGEIGILPGHAPLVTTLSEGIVKYKIKKTSPYKKIAVSWGYLEVSPKGVTLLAETAEKEGDINRERSKKALKEARLQLDNIHKMDPKDILRYQRKIKRAQARLRTSYKN